MEIMSARGRVRVGHAHHHHQEEQEEEEEGGDGGGGEETAVAGAAAMTSRKRARIEREREPSRAATSPSMSKSGDDVDSDSQTTELTRDDDEFDDAQSTSIATGTSPQRTRHRAATRPSSAPVAAAAGAPPEIETMDVNAEDFKMMRPNELMAIFEQMYQNFVYANDTGRENHLQQRSPESMIRWAYQILNIDNETNSRDIDLAARQMNEGLCALFAALVEKRLIGLSTEDERRVSEKFSRMKQIWRFAYSAVKSLVLMHDSAMGFNTLTVSSEDLQGIMYPPDAEPPEGKQVNVQQRLILGLLWEIRNRNLRRVKDGDNYYEQVVTPEGIPSHCYQDQGTMVDLVYTICNRDTNPQMWSLLTDGNNATGMAKNLATYLRDCQEHEFPFIDRNRAWCNHSFRNGVLIMDTSVYEPGWDINRPSSVNPHTMTFLPYGSPQLTSDIVTINYHNEYMPEEFFNPESEAYHDPDLIPTPIHDSIFRDQNIPQDAIDWFQALGYGRSLFPLGRFDQWHCGVVIIGGPGTGKTTVADSVTDMLPTKAVNALRMVVQKEFAIADLIDGMMWVCHELREKGWTVPEDLLLMMLEGRRNMSAGRKYKCDAKILKWLLPALLIGNAMPSEWPEAVLRRIIVWRFDLTPPVQNPNLRRDLEKERPLIMIKGVRKYFQLVQKYKDEDLYRNMPEYCKDIMERVTKTLVPVVRMMKESTDVEIIRDGVMSLKELRSNFKVWKTDNDLKHISFPNLEDLERMLRSVGVQLVKQKPGESTSANGRVYSDTHILKGARLMDRMMMGGGGGGEHISDSSTHHHHHQQSIGGASTRTGTGPGAGTGRDAHGSSRRDTQQLQHAQFDDSIYTPFEHDGLAVSEGR